MWGTLTFHGAFEIRSPLAQPGSSSVMNSFCYWPLPYSSHAQNSLNGCTSAVFVPWMGNYHREKSWRVVGNRDPKGAWKWLMGYKRKEIEKE